MTYNLYGAITKLGEHDKIAVVKPIFVREQYKNKFYERTNEGEFIETDISAYPEIQIPTRKPNVQNKNITYLILYRPGYNRTKVGKLMRGRTVAVQDKSNDEAWTPSEITVGIKFPASFICAPIDNLTSKELETYT